MARRRRGKSGTGLLADLRRVVHIKAARHAHVRARRRAGIQVFWRFGLRGIRRTLVSRVCRGVSAHGLFDTQTQYKHRKSDRAPGVRRFIRRCWKGDHALIRRRSYDSLSSAGLRGAGQTTRGTRKSTCGKSGRGTFLSTGIDGDREVLSGTVRRLPQSGVEYRSAYERSESGALGPGAYKDCRGRGGTSRPGRGNAPQTKRGRGSKSNSAERSRSGNSRSDCRSRERRKNAGLDAESRFSP